MNMKQFEKSKTDKMTDKTAKYKEGSKKDKALDKKLLKIVNKKKKK